MPFPARSSLITRTRLLLRQRKWQHAARLADVAIEEARKIGDRKIECTALMLRALAMVHARNLTKRLAQSLERMSLVRGACASTWVCFRQVCSQINRPIVICKRNRSLEQKESGVSKVTLVLRMSPMFWQLEH